MRMWPFSPRLSHSAPCCTDCALGPGLQCGGGALQRAGLHHSRGRNPGAAVPGDGTPQAPGTQEPSRMHTRTLSVSLSRSPSISLSLPLSEQSGCWALRSLLSVALVRFAGQRRWAEPRIGRAVKPRPPSTMRRCGSRRSAATKGGATTARRRTDLARPLSTPFAWTSTVSARTHTHLTNQKRSTPESPAGENCKHEGNTAS